MKKFRVAPHDTDNFQDITKESVLDSIPHRKRVIKKKPNWYSDDSEIDEFDLRKSTLHSLHAKKIKNQQFYQRLFRSANNNDNNNNDDDNNDDNDNIGIKDDEIRSLLKVKNKSGSNYSQRNGWWVNMLGLNPHHNHYNHQIQPDPIEELLYEYDKTINVQTLKNKIHHTNGYLDSFNFIINNNNNNNNNNNKIIVDTNEELNPLQEEQHVTLSKSKP
eukprot:gene13852-18578_t